MAKAKSTLPQFPHKLVLWLIFSVIITVFCGLVYVALQQDMRIGANDPQIQMAEDSATALSAGEKVTPQGSVDVASSIAPFVIIYDAEGNVVQSGARLNGKVPQLPFGVFQSVRNNGEERFTWQPEVGVRIAAVITGYSDNGGYVLAGRSLREVENRINILGMQVGVVWVVSIGIVTVLSVFL